jgi:hypothetical protein
VRLAFLCCEQCRPDDVLATPREILDVAIWLLTPRSSRELRGLVTLLDVDLFVRGRRDPAIPADGPWWIN